MLDNTRASTTMDSYETEKLGEQLLSSASGLEDELSGMISSVQHRLDIPIQVDSENRTSMSTSRDQIKIGFERRDGSLVQSIFSSYSVLDKMIPVDSELRGNADKCTRILSSEKICAALVALGIHTDAQGAEVLFQEFDTDNSSGLSLEEFQQLVRKPQPLVEWAKTQDLPEMLADAIPRKEGVDALRVVSDLTEDEIENVLGALLEGLGTVLRKSVKALKHAFAVSDSRSKSLSSDISTGSKFDVIALSCGNIDDFHAGLAGRIGTPNLKFEASMKSEHCDSFDSHKSFTVSNYGVTTTPEAEWQIVIHCDISKADMRHGRKLQKVEDIVKQEQTKKSKLSRPEVLAVVMYTGPMFDPYNTVLRRFPAERYREYVEGGNTYTTTIYVLVSAITNIARETKLPAELKLYRGLAGKSFPASFHKSDDKGRKGMLEWGFMSTTADKATAIRYCGVSQSKPVPTILEFDSGAVDRGAVITHLSQYPGEKECLFPPCSFLAPIGGASVEVTEFGVVNKVLLRVNANTKTPTCQELQAQKKRMHLASFQYLLENLERKLKERASSPNAEERKKADFSYLYLERGQSGLVSNIMVKCRKIYDYHKAMNEEIYFDDAVYRGLVAESLDVIAMAENMFQLWLCGSKTAYFASLDSLMVCHRLWITEQKKQLESCPVEKREETALELCRNMGLVRTSVNERSVFGETPLLCAAANGASSWEIELLVMARSDVAATTSDGSCAVMLSAMFGHVELIETLKQLGAEPLRHRRGFGGPQTPMHAAAESGFPKVIETLVRFSGDVTGQDQYLTPIFLAARSGHSDTIAVLAALGADVHGPGNRFNGRTPLHVASIQCRLKAVETLLRLGADPSSKRSMPRCYEDGETPMHEAASGGHVGIITLLHQAGASVTVARSDGGTPMFNAAYNGNVAAIEALHRLGAEAATTLTDGMTAVMAAAESGRVKAVEALARLGADVATTMPGGEGAVHVAARGGHVATLDALAALGADAAGPMPGWAAARRPGLLVSAIVRPPSIVGIPLRAAAEMMHTALPGLVW